MTITVPDELAKEIGLSEASAKLELAISLYQRRAISLGKAAEFAGLGRLDLQRELQRQGVPLNYGVADLERTSWCFARPASCDRRNRHFSADPSGDHWAP